MISGSRLFKKFDLGLEATGELSGWSGEPARTGGLAETVYGQSRKMVVEA
jgi:hypothetical protein